MKPENFRLKMSIKIRRNWNGVKINDSKKSETIEAKTVIKNKKMYNINFQIEYYISIPKNMFLTIDNSYGKIEIDKLNKGIILDLKYGELTIDSLLSNNNIITNHWVK